MLKYTSPKRREETGKQDRINRNQTTKIEDLNLNVSITTWHVNVPNTPIKRQRLSY